MRKTLLVIFFLQILTFGFSQSIVVNGSSAPESNFGAEQLLTDVLLDGGACSTISNFQLKENPLQSFPSANRSWGFFSKGNSAFPFEEGILLTSGYASEADGPDSGIKSQGTSAWTGDSQLSALAGIGTSNATIFEFDFVPQGNEISFNYIFASEEYPQYACSDYNDVFAFIISGPGIENDPGLDGKNIALLPNGLPVTINNVNGSSYHPGGYGECGDDTYYVDGLFQDIEYGGRTVPLTAFSEVQSGQTYHIRLMIADSNDSSYDSAVFLEAGSFNLGSTIIDQNGIDIGDNLTICGQDDYTLYVGASDPNIQIQWYFNDDIIDGATSNSLVINQSGIYKVVVLSGDCTASDQVEIQFGDLETNGTSFLLEELDADNNGTETFDLTSIEPQIVEVPTQYTFEFYTSEEDAQNQTNPITNPTTYEGHHNEIINVRVTNEDGCWSVVTLRLRLEQNENPCNFTPVCSNATFTGDPPVGNPAGTILSSCQTLESEDVTWYYVRIQSGTTFTFLISPLGEVDYDFATWLNPDMSDCQNLGIADRASYDAPSIGEYVTGLMMDETDDCETATGGGLVGGMVRHLEVQPGDIIVIAVDKFSNQAPGFELSFGGDAVLDCTILGELSYAECDNDGDGQVQFDLASIAQDIIADDPGYAVTFYETEADATDDTGNNIIPTAPYTVTTATSPVIIYAQIKDDLGEVDEVNTITLSINEGVTGAQNASYETCDLGGDGTETIDLTQFNLIANPSNYTIHYYEDENAATEGNATFIPNPTAYETGPATIYVRIENENGCFVVVQINIAIQDLSVDLGEDFSMCVGDFTLTAAGDFSQFTDVTFTWTHNGDPIVGETGNTITINDTGQYGVTVNTAEGCSGTDTVNVTEGDAATVTTVTVGPDYVIVDAAGGVQPYQYSLTGVVWQDSNQFNYLQPGIYTVYVKTDEGCISTAEFAVFFIPTMFTPNGDGVNDTWNIPGMEVYQGSDVVIYDRTGRLVYQSKLDSKVIWNGYFMNGQKAPTQDYWYIINVTDGRKFTGHITVKSRGEKN